MGPLSLTVSGGGEGLNYIDSFAGGTQTAFCSDNLWDEKIRGRYLGTTETETINTTRKLDQSRV